jgi:hypothetical protein
VVTGPAVPKINLLLPLDVSTAAGQMRAHAATEEHLKKVKQAATRKTRVAPPAIAAGTADRGPRPAAPVGDDDEIPAFLDRTRFELEEAA